MHILPKLTRTNYRINIDNDYFTMDFVAFEGGWGKRSPSKIQCGGKVEATVRGTNVRGEANAQGIMSVSRHGMLQSTMLIYEPQVR